MATIKLPADPEVDGNVWCDACQQSLLAARSTTHLASKKHAENAEKLAAQKATQSRSKKLTKKAPAEDESDESSTDEERPAKKAPIRGRTKVAEPAEKPKKTPRAKAPASSDRPSHGLVADPNKAGNFYCGICKVSLTPTKADSHLDTARHQANQAKTLNAAMSNLGMDDDD